jgi:transposase
MGKKNNQNFVNIPFGKLKKKVKYLCELNGITFVEQEESYTSKASFWDKDEIPVYTPGDETKYAFSGKRIKRGLYRCANGRLINADLNGALNILRKSKVVDLTVLYNSGVVETPVRLRVV